MTGLRVPKGPKLVSQGYLGQSGNPEANLVLQYITLSVSEPHFVLEISLPLITHRNGPVFRIETRLGLQCQTPALSKVCFTYVGTIILGLKKSGSKRNLRMKKFLVPKKYFGRKRKQSQLLDYYLTCVGK